jgi:hypothetical protein
MLSCQARWGLGVAGLRRGGLRGLSGFFLNGQGNVEPWGDHLHFLIGLA